jgi:phosphatidylserine/phosphatidylglycerophosphate/cardiolipin synthase-like enzyme
MSGETLPSALRKRTKTAGRFGERKIRRLEQGLFFLQGWRMNCPEAMSVSIPHLIVEPDDGVEPVRNLINSAEKSLLIKQFTFSEPTLMQAVTDRKNAGVKVRVMLNPKRSGGDRANDDTYDYFKQNGVAIQWANPKFYVTHEKSIVVDSHAALISTFNLCLKYFTQTRDYGVVTHDPVRVAQVMEGFEADWEHRDWLPDPESGLLWSNANSRLRMSHFIDTAKHKLDVQHPKFVDAVILDRLLDAAERGVHVRVLCGGKHGISDWDVLDTFSSLRVLKRFGVKVHKQKNLRLHAKLLIADDTHALVGSMNIDRSAFDLRRELGTTIKDESVVNRLIQIFDSDWDHSHSYDPPDPLDPSQHKETDFPHDHELRHE